MDGRCGSCKHFAYYNESYGAGICLQMGRTAGGAPNTIGSLAVASLRGPQDRDVCVRVAPEFGCLMFEPINTQTDVAGETGGRGDGTVDALSVAIRQRDVARQLASDRADDLARQERIVTAARAWVEANRALHAVRGGMMHPEWLSKATTERDARQRLHNAVDVAPH